MKSFRRRFFVSLCALSVSVVFLELETSIHSPLLITFLIPRISIQKNIVYLYSNLSSCHMPKL